MSPGRDRTAWVTGEVGVTLLHGNRVRQVTGALNVYATTPDAFDDDAITIAQKFAGFAAVGLANAHLYENQTTLAAHLQKAMANRAVIEQAKGIIMNHRHCSPDQAFVVLTRMSQAANRKLRDIASAPADNAHGGPLP